MADDLQLARAASDAALATDGVHSLGSGLFVEAATYGVGEAVSGVVVTDNKVEVHIIAEYRTSKSIPEIAEGVKENVAPEVEGRETAVVVEDLEVVQE